MDTPHSHTVLRFAFGVTLAFVVAELMKWNPPYLAPVLTCVLLANIPVRPPIKVALGFSLVICGSAYLGVLLAYAFRGAPHILFGMVTLIVFHALYALAKGASRLVPLFILVCATAVPVVGLQSLVAAETFAATFTKGALVAVFMTWVSWLVFPKALPPRAAPEAAPLSGPVAIRSALLGTAILAPITLTYLMFGLYTAIPVIVGTVMIVATLDFHLGRKQAMLRVVANFCGGVSSVIVLILLAIHPSLATFALLVLASALLFGLRISHGDPMAQLLVVACNGYLIVFGTALHSDAGSFDVWLTRLFYFFLAGLFTVGMMVLIWPRELDLEDPP
ncbi:MAG TPA: DUF2955 domain-containing protein [Steroidobacteraceae bacterium]|nr:DUF2955 domain-containing protein [Steroidobacteraceae bacterium]